MYNNSANEMLMGGGIPSMKFDVVGVTVTGTIAAEPKVEQQRDYNSGEPLTWEDGSPRQQIRLVLDTDLRDPADPYDEGQRALYVKSGLMKAVRTAIRAAGAKGLEVGGKLTVTYTGNGEPSKRGAHPPKIYSAVYESPGAPALDLNSVAQGPSTADPWAAPTPAVAPPAQAQAQAPQAPAPAPAAQSSGLPDHPAFANLSAEQRSALAQIGPDQRKALGYPA